MTAIGDNSQVVARDQLRAFVERVERLHEERKAIADDIRNVYAEAKANGFDTKAMKHVVKLRGQDLAERQEFDAIVDLYMVALGMKPDEGDLGDIPSRVHVHARETPDPATGEIMEHASAPTHTVEAKPAPRSAPEALPDIPEFLRRKPSVAPEQQI